MNTFTDAQLVVSREVSDLLDRLGRDGFTPDARERDAFTTLAENGFIVESRATDRRNIEDFFTEFRSGQDQLRVTVIATGLSSVARRAQPPLSVVQPQGAQGYGQRTGTDNLPILNQPAQVGGAQAQPDSGADRRRQIRHRIGGVAGVDERRESP